MGRPVTIYTIGFTKKPAREFFGLLSESKARRLVDVRLNNVSQLSGFAKKADLAFFVHEICGMQYHHEPLLAPTSELLDSYRSGSVSWAEYEAAFNNLLTERAVELSLTRDLVDDSVLLCSEPTAQKCHRRLAAEYLARHWGGLSVQHL